MMHLWTRLSRERPWLLVSGEETVAITVLNLTFLFNFISFFSLVFCHKLLNGVQLLVITNDPFSSLRCTTVYHCVLLHLPRGTPVSQRTPEGGGVTSQNTASASDPENRGHGSFTCSRVCTDTRPYREIHRLWRGGSAAAALVDHCTVSVDVPHVSRLSGKSRSRRIMTVAAWCPHPSIPRRLSVPEQASKKRRVMGLGLQGLCFLDFPQNTLHSPPLFSPSPHYPQPPSLLLSPVRLLSSSPQ